MTNTSAPPPPEGFRVLVTGSRDLPDGRDVWAALDAIRAEHGTLTVVHGDCPTGADAAAVAYAFSTPNVYEEAHPADWKKHGKAAGPLRNQAMVDLGADICLAFPMGQSRGTRDCMRRAEAAGIPVVDHEAGVDRG